MKEEVGKATNDPDLEVSGRAEKKAGKVQEWISRAEKAVGEYKEAPTPPHKRPQEIGPCHEP